jgi:hypothetical protein
MLLPSLPLLPLSWTCGKMSLTYWRVGPLVVFREKDYKLLDSTKMGNFVTISFVIKRSSFTTPLPADSYLLAQLVTWLIFLMPSYLFG